VPQKLSLLTESNASGRLGNAGCNQKGGVAAAAGVSQSSAAPVGVRPGLVLCTERIWPVWHMVRSPLHQQDTLAGCVL